MQKHAVHCRRDVGRVSAIVAIIVLASCVDAAPNLPVVGQRASKSDGTCGVSYTVTTDNHDDELASYGVADHSETVDVCQTWSGADYSVTTTILSSTQPEFNEPDAVRTVNYSNGYADGVDASNGVVPPENVGSNAFDYVAATEAERQASYDNPYYGVGGGGATCDPVLDPGCCDHPGCGPAEMARAVSDSMSAASSGLRHGLKRRGVRFLVNDLDEIASPSADTRVFKGRRGSEQVTIELDRKSQLIIGEEHVSDADSIRVSHTWGKVRNRPVRNKTLIVGASKGADGKWHGFKTTLTITNVNWSAK